VIFYHEYKPLRLLCGHLSYPRVISPGISGIAPSGQKKESRDPKNQARPEPIHRLETDIHSRALVAQGDFKVTETVVMEDFLLMYV